MTRKNLVKFAVMMMAMVAMVCNAQGFSEADAATMRGMNMEWDAEVVAAAPAAKTTKSVNVRQLSAASARRQQTTTRTASQNTYAQNAQQNLTPMQQQLQNVASASQQQEVICGTIEHVYNQGFGRARVQVRKAGMFGGVYTYTFLGYPEDDVMKPAKGDYVCFIVTYGQNGPNDYPLVNFQEMINTTWMTRYMLWYKEHYYGGNTAMMFSANPKMSKWNNAISMVMSGAMTVASVVSLIKAIF